MEESGGGDVKLASRRKAGRRSGIADDSNYLPQRQDADGRRLHLPAYPGAVLRISHPNVTHTGNVLTMRRRDITSGLGPIPFFSALGTFF